MDHSSRPTLPPLHSLNLPRGGIPLPRIHELYDLHDHSRRDLHLNLPNGHEQPPIPQLVTPRTPSSSDSYLRPCTNTPASPVVATPLTPTSWPFPPHKIRLVPTTFENANAVILVPPPHVPLQPVLLVGSAVERLRHPRRQLPEGVRIHPYRVARPVDGRPPTGLSQTKGP
ncbi:hypothetical protein JVT61DRAFT_15194 [Boletus reticuloceps]|uniref:Uncharacterized protein n=1 Tax=Boletus reticuloceps TaxID=495285 RepID=A0A8I2YT94_9AGAM|nr:hypothetical protein JVT61DRAFT_15194 [Boletus reticuloceps]